MVVKSEGNSSKKKLSSGLGIIHSYTNLPRWIPARMIGDGSCGNGEWGLSESLDGFAVGESVGDIFVIFVDTFLLLMEEILHHLGWKKPCK